MIVGELETVFGLDAGELHIGQPRRDLAATQLSQTTRGHHPQTDVLTSRHRGTLTRQDAAKTDMSSGQSPRPTPLSGSEHMTEQHILARTGASLRMHQHRTGKNYLRLCDLDPNLPFIPVLQGQSVADYHRSADWYERHGVDLAALPLVGVGSICRRQHTAEVEQILRSLAARGYRLHAFGAKVLGLERYADAIASSDSMAWSRRGRYVPRCTPTHRTESNCLRFALSWHQNLIAKFPARQADRPARASGVLRVAA